MPLEKKYLITGHFNGRAHHFTQGTIEQITHSGIAKFAWGEPINGQLFEISILEIEPPPSFKAIQRWNRGDHFFELRENGTLWKIEGNREEEILR